VVPGSCSAEQENSNSPRPMGPNRR
jgi:hypothetical protein